MLEEMKKAGQCSQEKKIRKGEIICNYDGEVCTYKELKERKKNTCCVGLGVTF